MPTALPHSIRTDFTEMMKCRYPLIGAPMFLVSNVDMVVAISEAGGVGTFPALNYRPIEEYKNALTQIRERTASPIGVNIIVNKSNQRQGEDLRWALEAGVDLIITSLGNPKTVISEAHKSGTKVVCDVTNLEHALKVQDLGADGVIAVSAGAGGHAGPLSPFALVPWLKKELSIPVIAAGGVGSGATMAAALSLGADAVSVGTRFIACKEATVDKAYKEAIVQSTPEDIVLTTRISGTPASVILTDYVKKLGTDLPWWLKTLKDNPRTKKWAVPFIHWRGSEALKQAAERPTWKSVWSAGQTVGQIEDILDCRSLVERIVQEYSETIQNLQKGLCDDINESSAPNV